PARKLSAALAAGCSVIIKPGEESPATALALARALDDAGLPKGVLQVVFGVPDEVVSWNRFSPFASRPVGLMNVATCNEPICVVAVE
ncbi:aldehyde dehydrogenase family protein, partial [Paraburkholderia sp. SIMBA_053]